MITTELSDADIAKQHNAMPPDTHEPQKLSKSVMLAYRRAKAASTKQDLSTSHRMQLTRMERANRVDHTDESDQTTLCDF